MIYISPSLTNFNYDGRKAFGAHSVSAEEVLSLIRQQKVKLCRGDSAVMKAVQAHLGINNEIPEVSPPVMIEKGDSVILSVIYDLPYLDQQGRLVGIRIEKLGCIFIIYTFA